MNPTYSKLQARLKAKSKIWLITGVAGFIGSNLLETLLKLNQRVVGLDNLSTGHQHNLDEVKALVAPSMWANFRFLKGDVCNLDTCHRAMWWSPKSEAITERSDLAERVEYVLHQAALGSVPRSIEDPIATNQSNISGFLNILVAARDAGVNRFVYAASSSTYGDHAALPKVEAEIGKPLSPYAVTKLVNELYADVFATTYGFETIGLRYFNVFGPRQDPAGAYAAVLPKWISAIAKGEPVYINGDGETSRDFCYIDNTVQANLLAATVEDEAAVNQVYNVAVGDRTSLADVYTHIRDNLVEHHPNLCNATPVHRQFRRGDIKHSLADISKAKNFLGYMPTHRIVSGLNETIKWYLARNL